MLSHKIFEDYGIVIPEDGFSEETFMHSVMVGNAAKIIAQHTKTLDPEHAFVCGLMHDVGKFFLSKEQMYKHPIVGYDLLKETQPEVANVCVSHPFPIERLKEYIVYYCRQDLETADKIEHFLLGIEYTDYIKLIQLCDKISIAKKYVLLSTRLEAKFQWYKERNLIDEKLLNQQYNAYLSIKQYFDNLVGADIYQLLDIHEV